MSHQVIFKVTPVPCALSDLTLPSTTDADLATTIFYYSEPDQEFLFLGADGNGCSFTTSLARVILNSETIANTQGGSWDHTLGKWTTLKSEYH